MHVSIVNWTKGEEAGLKKLFRQVGDRVDSPWEVDEVERIGAALSEKFDVTTAAELGIKKDSDTCDQGQTHGHEAFLLSPGEAQTMIATDRRNADVIKPYIIGDDILSENPPQATRFVIDFAPRDLHQSKEHTEPFRRVQRFVLPDREVKAKEEEERNREAQEDRSIPRMCCTPVMTHDDSAGDIQRIEKSDQITCRLKRRV